MLPPDEEIQTQLLGRIAAGDRPALGEFYDQTGGGLYSMVFRMLGNRQDAEEAVQDVFVQIWTKAPTYDPVLGLPFNWASRIARNRCIDILRARQRRSRVLVDSPLPENAETAADPASADATLAQEELGGIRSAVQGLPPDQRQAIEMAFFGGLTHPEIAAALKEPLGTIKARIRRGMLKLRESLRAYT
jgi:RNA polymerase sigma-70 factor (ECF subfamily)